MSTGYSPPPTIAASIVMTTKGDLAGYSTERTRIAVGSDAQVLTADSAQGLGLKWATVIITALTPWTEPIDGAAFALSNVGVLNLKIVNTTALMELEADHTTPAVEQVIGQIQFIDDDSGGNRTIYSEIRSRIISATDTDENGEIFFDVMQNGTLQTYMVLNEQDGNDIEFKKSLKIGGTTIYGSGAMPAVGLLKFTAGTNSLAWDALTGFAYFDLSTADKFRMYINGVEYEFGKTEADFKANNIIGLAALTLTGDINLSDSSQLIWAGNADRRIQNTTAGFIFEIETGDVYDFTINNTLAFKITGSNIQLSDAVNILVATGTGSKIGTATTQKLGFWDTTPAVQQVHVVDPTDLASCIVAITAINAKDAIIGLTASS